MAKFYYNGVLLPEIPSDVLAKYPYCLIRENAQTGYYDLIFAEVPWCFNNGIYASSSYKVIIPWYRIPLQSANSMSEWQYNMESTSAFNDGVFSIAYDRIVLWSNHDIPNGSPSSTAVYFYGSEPVPEDSSSEDESIKYKYLIRSNNALYTIEDTVLTALEITKLTSDVFKKYGFSELPDSSFLLGLWNPEILYWQEDETEYLPTMTAYMTALPTPKVLLAEKFNIDDSSFKGISSVDCEHTGSPLIALSFDEGDFEYYDSNNGWITASELEGMIPVVLTTITTEEWSAKLAGVKTIQIKVILDSADDSLTSIKFNFIQ